MPKIRTWTGQTPKIIIGKLIRDTGSGLIVEDERGVRYFARPADVLSEDDLFAPMVLTRDSK